LVVNDQKQIRYGKCHTEVRLGDRVNTRLFLFLRRTGRVVYVPGISQPHEEMEHDGIRLIGVKFDKGGFGGFWVESSDSTVIKTVTFLRRDNSPVEETLPDEGW